MIELKRLIGTGVQINEYTVLELNTPTISKISQYFD